MTLTITVDFEAGNGLEMETNLNKAIDEIGSVLKHKGLGPQTEYEVKGVVLVNGELKELYKVTIK